MSDRREFIKTAFNLGLAASILPLAQGCSSSDYAGRLNLAWAPDAIDYPDKPDDYKSIIRFATLAPSGHNSQPWQFNIKGDYIRLYADYGRRLKIADPDDRELFISLGCALENFIIASGYYGYKPKVEYFPEGGFPEYIGLKMKADASKTDINPALFGSITKRQTNRGEFDKIKIPDEYLGRVENLKLEEGVCCLVITDKPAKKEIISLVKKANDLQINNLPFMDELVSWMRFNDSESAETMDGLTNRSMGASSWPGWIGRFYTKNFMSSKKESLKDEKYINNSSALIAVFSDDDKKKNRILTGRSLQRILLTLTEMDVKYSFLNQPVQVESLRYQLASLLQSGPWHPQLLFRTGFGHSMPHSPRRAVGQVII